MMQGQTSSSALAYFLVGVFPAQAMLQLWVAVATSHVGPSLKDPALLPTALLLPTAASFGLAMSHSDQSPVNEWCHKMNADSAATLAAAAADGLPC